MSIRYGKSHAQLKREIAEALATPRRGAHCYACETGACARHADPARYGDTPINHRASGTKKPAPRKKQAHATRASGLAAYRNLVAKAIARCSKHPRPNHSLYECVFEEVHGGAPYPTPQQRRLLEDAVHAARPASNLHAKKKKLDHYEAKQRLRTAGIDFSRDFHSLPSSQVDLILNMARATGYRKRKDAPGSTARMYFQYLDRLK